MNGTVNCEAYTSFEGVSSDYRIILAKIHLSLCRNKTNNDIRNYYMVNIRNKFDTYQEISDRHTSNDKYKFFYHPYEAAAKHIQAKPRAKCEAIAIREKRNNMKMAS